MSKKEEKARPAARTAVVLAPYSPPGVGVAANLGSATKIESIVRILAGIYDSVALVNSAHNEREILPARIAAQNFPARSPLPVAVMTPRVWGASRKAGKLLQFLLQGSSRQFLRSLQPSLVWVYNGYAFDARLALWAKRELGCKVVLEVEDWPTARGRGANPKPFLDLLTFNRLAPVCDVITAINSNIAERMSASCPQVIELPGAIGEDLTTQAVAPPFSGAGQPRVAGYFGGLNREKGGQLLLDLARSRPAGWRFVVAGAGPLSAAFEEAARTCDNLRFLGTVPRATLVSEMGKVDAILNPHSPIELFDQGIFPFKVFEAMALGRLLISTPLPDTRIRIKGAVKYFDGSPEGLRGALVQAAEFYAENRAKIEQARDLLIAEYGEAALRAQFAGLLGGHP